MANSSPSPIRVAAVGTGNVGKHALTQLINDDRFDLTAVWVSSGAKAGKDAADLAGLPGSTGILATTDLDAVIATRPPSSELHVCEMSQMCVPPTYLTIQHSRENKKN